MLEAAGIIDPGYNEPDLLRADGAAIISEWRTLLFANLSRRWIEQES